MKKTTPCAERQHKKGSLHNVGGKGETAQFMLILEHVGDFFGNEGGGRYHFPSLPPSINTESLAGGRAVLTLVALARAQGRFCSSCSCTLPSHLVHSWCAMASHHPLPTWYPQVTIAGRAQLCPAIVAHCAQPCAPATLV